MASLVHSFPDQRMEQGAGGAKDSRARLGLGPHVADYALIFANRFWLVEPALWRTVAAAGFFVLAIVLSATAVRASGGTCALMQRSSRITR